MTYFCAMRRSFFYLFPVLLLASGCQTLDLYEKTVALPGKAWASSYQPSFTFTIRDTTAVYDLQLVLRHSDRYHFNNIWVQVSVKTPKADSAYSFRAERILGTDEQGWLGTGMDDIYEHRISLNDKLGEAGISLRQKGDYTITLRQIMREDPLQQVWNAGIRLEKKP